jgi:glutamine synthetase
MHSSLWDRRNGQGAVPRARPAGERAVPALAGRGRWRWRATFALLYAPTINSTGAIRPGSFAPTRIAAGWDNRTCGFRICGEGAGFRVENRIPGADANPYLAFAATIAAGLHGIDKRLKGPKPYTGNAYEDPKLAQVPKTFREALDTLEGSRVAREAFGAKVVDHYLRLGRLEQQAFDQVVTDWELIRHFERI